MRFFISGLALGLVILTTLNAAELEYSRAYKRDDIYIVDLSMLVKVPEIYARNVLMNPDRFNQLNSAVVEIEHLPEKDPGIRRFREKTFVCALFFCITYQNIMQLALLKNRDIELKVEPEGSDFEYGHVVWRTASLGETYSRLSFHAETKPSFWVPPVLGTMILGSRMTDVLYEMVRRMECDYGGKTVCDLFIPDDVEDEEAFQ